MAAPPTEMSNGGAGDGGDGDGGKVQDGDQPAAIEAPAYSFTPDRATPACLASVDASTLRAAHEGDDAPDSPASAAKSRRRASSRRHDSKRTFWRRARWSPDSGTHVLAQADDHCVEIFRVVNGSAESESGGDGAALRLQRVLCWRAPSPILEACWYPYAAFDPSRSCSTSGKGADRTASDADEQHAWLFAVSCRDTPMKLVDAYTGKTRTSFALESHVETLLSAHALAFAAYYIPHDPQSPPSDPSTATAPAYTAGLTLYAGLSAPVAAQLAVLDVTPGGGSKGGGVGSGRVALGLRAGHSAARAARGHFEPARGEGGGAASKRRKADAPGPLGQRGLISALALGVDVVSASASGEGGEELLAIGTLDGSIGLYSTAALRAIAAASGADAFDPHRVESLHTIGLAACLAGWRAGTPQHDADADPQLAAEEATDPAISQLAFHPTAPYLLFVAQRRYKGRVLVYDTRYLPRRAAFGAATSASAGTAGGAADLSQIDFAAVPVGRALAAVLNVRPRSDGADADTDNQRIFFDVDWAGRWLVSGGPAPAEAPSHEPGAADGWVHAWDISEKALLGDDEDGSDADDDAARRTEKQAGQQHQSRLRVCSPRYSFRAHPSGSGGEDGEHTRVTSAALHPYYPMLLTTAGGRVRHGGTSREGEESSEEESEDGSEESASSSGSGSEEGHQANSMSPSQSQGSTSRRLELRTGAGMKLWDLR